MDTSRTPSYLQLVLMLGSGVEQLSGMAIRGIWKTWTGEARLSRALANLETSGLVERLQGGREVDARVYRLTEAGLAGAAGGRFPPARWTRHWDGKWRMLSFDIPQREASLRMRIRRQLIDRGFGAIQRSVWITPDPLDEIVAAMPEVAHRPGSLLLLEGRPAAGVSDEVLVGDAWDIAGINRGYTEYLSVLKAQPVPSGGAARLASGAWKNWLKAEATAWLHAVKQDPLLPEVLLPPGYRGREAWQRRLDVLGALPNLS